METAHSCCLRQKPCLKTDDLHSRDPKAPRLYFCDIHHPRTHAPFGMQAGENDQRGPAALHRAPASPNPKP